MLKYKLTEEVLYMKENFISSFDEKNYLLSTYFIIKDNVLLRTKNFNFEDNLSNCYYIKELGTVFNPKICVDKKENNKWTNKNQFLEDYNSLANFIFENKSNFICIRGFSRASICQLIRLINELKGTNIRPIKFSNEIARVKYERHILTKEDRIRKLHKKLEKTNESETSEDYLKISNSVFGERRILSRQKIIKKL